ncbi:MAG: hypothetical protein AAFR73_12375 [Pseudomonadota bacterium]
MIRFFTALIIFTAPAYAETTSQSLTPARSQSDFDELTFEQHDPITASVTYYNAQALTSRRTEQRYEGDNGLVCSASVTVGGGDNPETLTITCDPPWVANTPLPEVNDGDEVIVMLRLMGF